jgi:hypothetical protein
MSRRSRSQLPTSEVSPWDMNPRLIRNRKRGISSIIGGVIVFAMLFTIGFYYFYFIAQDNNIFQNAALSKNALASQQSNEHFVVYGITSNGNLGFVVNNTGISANIVAYWIVNSTTDVPLQYKNSTTLSGTLPYSISQGGSWSYTNTGVLITSSTQRFTIKILSARGTIAIGTYPSSYVTNQAVNAYAASDFGSLVMSFTTFNWYDYTSGPSSNYTGTPPSSCWYNGCNQFFDNMCANGARCNGGSWTVDVAHPHPGSMMPEGYNICSVSNNYQNCNYWQVPMVVSVTVTNDDPQLGNIVLNSETNLWITETCDFGASEGYCPNGNPVFVFYVMNVNPTTGAVTSTTQGSFSQLIIPYGATKTIYFGTQNDLSQHAFAGLALTSYSSTGQQNDAYYGEYATFLLFSGTKITAQGTQPYGQNIPFESLIAADNLVTYSETPMSCTAGQQATFSLVVNNSPFSPPDSSSFSYDGINQVVVNASAFTLGTVSSPTGWTGNANSPSAGFITWSTSNTNNEIANGGSATFTWVGTPPANANGQQLVIPITIYWKAGTFATISVSEQCQD